MMITSVVTSGAAMNISDAEWTVMRVAWAAPRGGGVTAAEVIAAVTPATGWNHRTVRTLLSRLVEKGALTAEADGHRNLYRSAVTRRKCVREAGRSFLDRVFAGDPAELLTHFVRDSDLPPEEIARLQRLLAEQRRKGGDA